MYIYKHTRSSIITLIGRSINWWGSFINSFDLDVAKFMLSTVYCTVLYRAARETSVRTRARLRS